MTAHESTHLRSSFIIISDIAPSLARLSGHLLVCAVKRSLDLTNKKLHPAVLSGNVNRWQHECRVFELIKHPTFITCRGGEHGPRPVGWATALSERETRPIRQ